MDTMVKGHIYVKCKNKEFDVKYMCDLCVFFLYEI